MRFSFYGSLAKCLIMDKVLNRSNSEHAANVKYLLVFQDKY